jgi:hypothetical protein
MFDIASFQNSSITGAMDTRRSVYPEGEYVLQIAADDKAVQIQGGMSAAKDDKPARPWARCTLKCRVVKCPETTSMDELAKLMGQPVDELYIYYGIMLDINDNGKLDGGPNRNVKLGAIRAAVGQNDGNIPWHYEMLKTQAFRAKVITVSSDKSDPEAKSNDIRGVAAYQ